MERTRKQGDTTIAIIVIIAGLATGGIITWRFLTPRPEPVYEPQYRVVNSMAEAEALAQAHAGVAPAAPDAPESPVPAEDAPADVPTPGGATGGAAPETGDAPVPDRPLDGPTDDDGRLIRDTARAQEAEGITEYVELTAPLYIRLSARAVLFANQVSRHPEDFPGDPQELMVEFMTKQLLKERVDPQAYYEYTHWVSSDHERAQRMGEQILREAERHVLPEDGAIDVSSVPGIAPAPVAPPDD